MSININTVTPIPTVTQQVQTNTNANQINNFANATKSVVLDQSNNIGYVNEPRAWGELYLTGNTTATTITTAGTYYQFSNNNWVTNALNSQFTLSSTTGLQYTGSTTYTFYVVFNVSAQTGVNNQSCSFQIYKNGAPLANCKSSTAISTALPQNCVITGLIQLANNDILSLYMTNSTANNPITCTEVSFECFAV